MPAPRDLLVSATTSFDGTTAFAGAWQPKADPAAPRISTTVETVGRFGFAELVRSGVTAAVVIARILDASSPHTMSVRSASSTENDALIIPDDPAPLVLDGAISATALSASWCVPLLLGPTDALTFSGGRNSVELLVFEIGAGEAAAVALKAAFDVIAASASSAISVVEINAAGVVPAWGPLRTYFLVDIAAPGGVLTLPDAADVPAGSEAYFINIGGTRVLVSPAAGESVNDQINGLFEVSGLGGTYVARVDAGFVTTSPLNVPTVTLANGVSGATVDLPQLTAPSLAINLNFTADTILRLPAASSAPKGWRYLITRTIGDSQITLVDIGGSFINGLLLGEVFMPAAPGGNGGAAVVVEASTHGWVVVGSNGLAPTPVRTVAVGDATLDPWGLDEIVVRLTQGAPQTATLPAIADVPIGAKARFLALGDDKTVAAVGADTIVGQAKPAAGTFAILENTALLLINSGLEWIAI